MTRSVLVFLLIGDEAGKSYICLGRKKTGHGLGKWNGFGGKNNKNEEPIDAAIRELEEESTVKAKKEDVNEIGYIEYFEPDGDWIVNVYACRQWEGDVTLTEEMEPKWFSYEDIPYDEMWPDDAIWLSKVLEGTKFKLSFWHDKDGKLLKKKWN